MRTTFCGVDGEAIRRALAARDDALIARVRAAVTEEAGEEEAAVRQTGDAELDAELRKLAGTRPSAGGALSVIEKRLRGEAEAADLPDEGYAGYVAARTIVDAVGGEPLTTNFEVKQFFWYDLAEAEDELGSAAPLVDALAEGRPFFGERIESECFYALFTPDETRALRDALQRVADSAGGAELEDVLADEDDGAIASLKEIIDAGRWLWAETT